MKTKSPETLATPKTAPLAFISPDRVYRLPAVKQFLSGGPRAFARLKRPGRDGRPRLLVLKIGRAGFVHGRNLIQIFDFLLEQAEGSAERHEVTQ